MLEYSTRAKGIFDTKWVRPAPEAYQLWTYDYEAARTDPAWAELRKAKDYYEELLGKLGCQNEDSAGTACGVDTLLAPVIKHNETYLHSVLTAAMDRNPMLNGSLSRQAKQSGEAGPAECYGEAKKTFIASLDLAPADRRAAIQASYAARCEAAEKNAAASAEAKAKAAANAAAAAPTVLKPYPSTGPVVAWGVVARVNPDLIPALTQRMDAALTATGVDAVNSVEFGSPSAPDVITIVADVSSSKSFIQVATVLPLVRTGAVRLRLVPISVLAEEGLSAEHLLSGAARMFALNLEQLSTWATAHNLPILAPSAEAVAKIEDNNRKLLAAGLYGTPYLRVEHAGKTYSSGALPTFKTFVQQPLLVEMLGTKGFLPGNATDFPSAKWTKAERQMLKDAGAFQGTGY